MEFRVYKINGVDVLTHVADGNKFYYKASDLGLACGFVKGSNFNLKVRKKLGCNEYVCYKISGGNAYFIDKAGFMKAMPDSSVEKVKLSMCVLADIEAVEEGNKENVFERPFVGLIPEENPEEKTETVESPEEKTEEVESPEDEIVRLRDIIRQKDEMIAELGKKAAYYDICLNSPELLSTTAIACDYGMSAKKFNETLAQLGVQFKDNNGDWQLYGKYIDKGYQANKVMSRLSRDGAIHTTMYRCWTQRGRNFIFDILHENGIFTVLEVNELEPGGNE